MFKHVLSSDQFHDSDQDRKYRDAFFQKFRFQERGIMASEPYADPWLIMETASSPPMERISHCIVYPIQDGMAIKMESKSATPTAVLTGTPMTTSSGMTRIGPPAPGSAQTAAVIRPKRIQTGRGICLFFVCARLSAETSVSGVSFFVLPQKDGETGE